MSEVIKMLKESSDPLENDLAQVYEHWQDTKRNQGLRAGLGYEPRDINAKGAIEVISTRVVNASSGFEEIDPKSSYEAIVLKYPDRFSAKVIDAAKERLKLGASLAHAFQAQDIKFFIKTSSFELFGETGLPISKNNWIGRKANIPNLLKENDYAAEFLANGFRSFIWLHEQEKHGERGPGLTAVVQFGAMDNEHHAKIIDVVIFERPVGKDLLEARKGDDEFIAKVDSSRHTRTWPISNNEVSVLLTAVRSKIHQIAAYENQNPDPNDAQNLEKIEDTTALRQVVLRRYQSAFRQALLSQRPNCCAISGTSEVTVLEAAHIVPYSEKYADRDQPENGLLLRRDIHKLFDAHLIAIDPKARTVEIAKSIKSTDYTRLKGNKIEDNISVKSLTHHFERFLAAGLERDKNDQ